MSRPFTWRPADSPASQPVVFFVSMNVSANHISEPTSLTGIRIVTSKLMTLLTTAISNSHWKSVHIGDRLRNYELVPAAASLKKSDERILQNLVLKTFLICLN
jgi:hypothetical protein